MNLLDLVLILPIAYGAWLGFKKGFIIEIATLLALVLGVWGAITFSDFMGDYLSKNTSVNGRYVSILAFTLTFLIIAIGVYFLGKFIEKSINMVAMKPINKFAGLGFGAIKWLFFVSVFLVLIEAHDDKSTFVNKGLKDKSVLYETVKEVSITVLPALKESDVVMETIHQGVDVLEILSDTL